MLGLQLYRVTSRIKDFLGNVGATVEVLWFVVNRPEPVGPYDKFIEDYREDEEWAEKALDELFTAEEMEALKTYLLRVYGVGGNGQVTVTATEMVLPLAKEALLSRDVETNGTWSFYKLAEKEDYELDFEVWGYYNAAAMCG